MKRLFSTVALAAMVVTGAAACQPGSGGGHQDPNSPAVKQQVADAFAAHVSSRVGRACYGIGVLTHWQGNGWYVDARCDNGTSIRTQYNGFADFNGFRIY